MSFATVGWPALDSQHLGKCRRRSHARCAQRPRPCRNRPTRCRQQASRRAERIADWLEQPGTRLIDITGDWMWPIHAVLDHEALVQYALGEVDDQRLSGQLRDRSCERRIARRRAKEEGADTLHCLRATTK